MKKIISILLCSFFINIFSACAFPNSENSQSSSQNQSSNSSSSSVNNSSGENNSSEDKKVGLWDAGEINLSHINPNKKYIAFTFDDGPVSGYGDELLQVFEEYNADNPDNIAHATLFVVGGKVNTTNESILSKAYSMGFELGNHSFNHVNLANLDTATLQEEISKTDEILKKIDGRDKHLIRPTGGHAENGLPNKVDVPLINWTTEPNLDSSDWTSISTDEICSRILTNSLEGGIVLMHMGYQNSVNAVRRLLPELNMAGYQIVTVSELAMLLDIDLYAGKVYSYIG